MTINVRPLPNLDRPETQPYWEGSREHQVVLPRCRDCGRWIWYPQRDCYVCGSHDLGWERLGGDGSVYSFVILRQALHPAFTSRIPFAVALVALDEAPYVRITANIIGCSVEDVSVGMSVEAAFEEITEDVTLLQFKPRIQSQASVVWSGR